MGRGIYLTADLKMAKSYGKNIYTLFANIKNPKKVNTREEDTQMLGSSLIYLKSKGKPSFDGVIDQFGIWLAISPNQIKLADGINTTFDQNNDDIRFETGGNLDKDIECHNCGWEWDKKDSEKFDMYVCHKCGFDNSGFYKLGGRTVAQTPAPSSERIYGSKRNKPSSSKDSSSAESIKFDQKTLTSIENKIEKHNAEHRDKRISLSIAKAIVRRGMGAYSKSHRPTIKGGKPNSRVAWGLARLNAFIYKAINGKSKSGKYTQDDDLFEELGIKVDKMENGGNLLLAPNGKPSNLTPEQYKLVRTPEFKAWFGDWENDPENASKVVDENGEPLVVYHGSSKNFYIFGEEKNKDILPQYQEQYKFKKNTHYFHKQKEYAETFGSKYGGIEKPYFLNVRKIELISDSEIEDIGYWKNIYENYVILKGVDGVYSLNGQYVTLLNPHQIKLADGTNTTFDPNNADIRFRDGGQINSSPFMEWYSQWYKGISDKMNILFSFPNEIVPFKEKNVVILDVFEKIDQNINAKPYLNEITKKADEYGVTIYLEPTPRHKHFQDNLEKKKKITKGYLIEYYEKFGFQLTPNKQFMKRLPENNTDIRYKEGGVLEFQSSKSMTIKNGSDLYKVQYRRNELGSTDKKVWFADVVSKNAKEVDGRLCFDNSRALNIFGFSLKEVENNIFEAYNSNELYIIIVDEYGVEIENTHIEKSNNENIRFFENGGEIDSKVENAKAELLKAFPTLNNLDFLGKGRFGYSFLIEINNELYVVKYTTSITEFWATQMAMVSNAPHVVKFLDAKELSEQFTYGIIHEYVNREGMISEDVWNYALLKADGLSPRKQGLNIEEIKKKVPPKALEYETKLVTKLVNELKDFFGTDLDLLQQNWGYNSNGELVLFDIDGNIKKSQYLEWMEKYKNEPKMAGGGNIDINEPFYVNGKNLAERVRILLKQLYPDYKWSVTSSYSNMNVYLLQADFDPFTEKWKEEHPDRELYYNVDDRDLRETNREDGNLTDRAIEVFKPIREYINKFVFNRNADDPYADYSNYNVYEYTYIGKWDKPYVQVAPKTGKKAKTKSPATPTVAPTPAPPKVEYPFQITDILAYSTKYLLTQPTNVAREMSEEWSLIWFFEEDESVSFSRYDKNNEPVTLRATKKEVLENFVQATAPPFKTGDLVALKDNPSKALKVKHRSYYQQTAITYPSEEKRFLLSGMFWLYELEDGSFRNENELISAQHIQPSITTQPEPKFKAGDIVRYKGATYNLIVEKSTYSDTFQTYLYDLRWESDGKSTTETEDKLELVSSAQPTPQNTFLDYLLANNERANEIPKTLELSSALAMFLVSAEKVGGLDTKKYAGLLTELLNNFEKTKTDGSN